MALGEGIIAARVVEGSFTRETFIEYLHDDVVCILYAFFSKLTHISSYLWPHLTQDLKVCLSWTMHRYITRPRLMISLEATVSNPSCILHVTFPKLVLGCRIEYLPPYSPDYNPIEQAFLVIKSHLCRIGIAFYPPHMLYYELYSACELITAEKTYGMFEHSGYDV